MKKVVVIYWSKTGNTRKAAEAISAGLTDAGAEVNLKTVSEAAGLDFFDYDLVCIGCPSYRWCPPDDVNDYMRNKFDAYRKIGCVKPGAPKTGNNALVFCTYSGPHTGINEAIPVGKYLGQFFEHLGFTLLDEWYILGEFHGSEVNSTQGRLGDIRGLPTKEDLRKLREDAQKIFEKL